MASSTHRRQLIAEAIADGFGRDVARIENGGVREGRLVKLVYVSGFDEPIVVTRDDVLLPDALKAAGPGIALDVAAVLASL